MKLFIFAIALFAIIVSNSAETDVCLREPYTSELRCGAHIPAFYYDNKKGECVSFIYGGCNSSGNLFKTKVGCEVRCKRVGVDICQLEPFIGSGNNCRAHMPSFYYDSKKGECISFVYGGCNTSGNIFVTKAGCEAICKKWDM